MAIRNIKEWSITLDDRSKFAKQYEDILEAFYKNLDIKPDYNKSYMTGCYTKEKFSKHFFKFLSKKILKYLIATAVSFAVAFVFITFNELHSNKIPIYLVKSFIVSILFFAVVKLLPIWFKYLKYKSQCKNMAKLEEDLKEIMMTIPSNYRSSLKMDAIAKVYYTKPTIDPSAILDTCDIFLENTNQYPKFAAIMFDLPCENRFLNIEDKQVVSINNNSAPTFDKNEFLPSDIDSKIFEGSKDSTKDLQNMIGLESVKQQIEKLKTRISFFGNTNNGNHMAFLGSAGTGKTSVARIITKIMFDLGYIKNNQYIEISGDYLCAGDTNRASAIIEYSYGGVLFIDEAYLMYKAGVDIVGVLLKAMEDHRQDFIVILAGYEEQMTKLFASNEGFTSRIKHSIYFPDYTEEEMLAIFEFFISDYNNTKYKLAEDAKNSLINLFTLEKRSKAFGNGRTVRNAVDAIMDYYADRSIREKSNNKIITSEDVELYIADRQKILQHELKNASAMDQIDEQIIRLAELKPRLKVGSENPMNDLNNLVGLESFNEYINILERQKEFYKDNTPHQSILLLGEEGSGKSTLAKILTGFLYQLGYIQENKYLDIPAEFLKGSFVGHTAKRAEAIISYASGGVLYISNYNTVVNSGDAFSGEVIAAINNAVVNNTNVTIILADYYSDAIESIYNTFTMAFEMPEYTVENLYEVFESLATTNGFVFENGVYDKFIEYAQNNNLKMRDVKQIYTNTINNHISRFSGNEEDRYFISVDDLVFAKPKLRLNLK